MADTEFKAMTDLLVALFFDGRTGVLMLLLVGAAVSDLRTHRIPNLLVLAGALYGLTYNLVFPPWRDGAVYFPFAGLVLGLLLFLPLYLLRAMGAGDVKLLAMAGAFLGPAGILRAAAASVLAGGVFAVLFVLARRTGPRLLNNLRTSLQLGFVQALSGSAPSFRIEPNVSAGKLPYGVAIAAGTIAYLVLHQLAFI